MRFGRLLLALLLGLVGATMLPPGRALAHTSIVRADPPDLCPNREGAYLLDPDLRCAAGTILTEPPREISLLFSEEVRPVGGGIIVLGPLGQAVESAPATVSGNMMSVPVSADAPGTYLVTWRVVSGDTHPAWGRYAFSVGHSSPLPGTDIRAAASVTQLGLGLQALGHWLHIGGFALAFGTLAFMLFVLGRGAESAAPLWRIVGLGNLALIVAEIPLLFGQMAALGTGQFFAGDLLAALLSSSYGIVLAQRLGMALLLWVLVSVVGPGGPAERLLGAVLLPGLALSVIDGQASHALGVEPLALGLAANAVHMLAMSVWVGGLVSLIVVVRQAVQPERRMLLLRFSRLALGAVLLLSISGALMAGAHIGDVVDLLNSGYGRALAAKLVLAALALGLAAAALYARSQRKLRLWLLELAALAIILLMAALLVTLPPPI